MYFWTETELFVTVRLALQLSVKGLEQHTDISSPHTRDYEDCCLLGCNIVQCGRQVPSYHAAWFHIPGSSLGYLNNLKFLCLTCAPVSDFLFFMVRWSMTVLLIQPWILYWSIILFCCESAEGGGQ